MTIIIVNELYCILMRKIRELQMTNDRVIRIIQNAIHSVSGCVKTMPNQDECRIYLSDCSLVCLFVCLPVCRFLCLPCLNCVRCAIVHFSRVRNREDAIQSSVVRKEIRCYFVNFEICSRRIADSETFIYFINVIHFTFSALNLLRMIAMRELFYYYFMRVEERIKMCI